MPFWEITKPVFGQDQPVPFRRRVLYTILLVLLFRVLASIPLFNVDEEAMHALLADNPLVGALDLLAGGDVLTSFSIVAAGIFPYLLALGLMKAATRIVRPLRALEEKGESGRKRLERITQVVTIPLAFLFAWGITHYFARETGLFPGKIRWFTASSFLSTFGVVGAMTLGTLLTLGVTSLISKKGIGAGENVILIFGACLGFIWRIIMLVVASPTGHIAGEQLTVEGLVVLLVFGLSQMLVKAERRIPVRAMKNPKFTGNYLPILANHGGVLPITSAVGLLTLLGFGINSFIAHFPREFPELHPALAALANPDKGAYWFAMGVLVVLLTYAHNFSVLWKPFADSDTTLTRDLRKNGFYIPDFRPGTETEEYLSRVTARHSLIGAATLATIAALLPYLVIRFTGQNVFVTVLAVFVFVETWNKLTPEVEAHAIEGKYAGLMKPKK